MLTDVAAAVPALQVRCLALPLHMPTTKSPDLLTPTAHLRQRNIDLNSEHVAAESTTAQSLDWLAPSDLGRFDLVLAADVVWVEDLIGPLVDSLQKLCRRGGMVLLAHQSRSTRADEALFDKVDRVFTR